MTCQTPKRLSQNLISKLSFIVLSNHIIINVTTLLRVTFNVLSCPWLSQMPDLIYLFNQDNLVSVSHHYITLHYQRAADRYAACYGTVFELAIS